MPRRSRASRTLCAMLAGATLLAAGYARFGAAGAQTPHFLPLAPSRQEVFTRHLQCTYGDRAHPSFDDAGCVIERWEPRDFEGFSEYQTGRDESLLCHELVFGDMQAEPWCAPGDCAEGRLFERGFEDFLEQKGYELVARPRSGDIAAYFFAGPRPERELGMAAHFGRYDGKQVVSKFGMGKAYRHDIGMVPDIYGDSVAFVRKVVEK